MNMSRTAITFPRPPPTCNTLSSSERTKLLKTTAKLGNVLGSTPHVVDEAFGFPSQSSQPALPIVKQKAKQRAWSLKSLKTSDTSKSESDVPPLPRSSISSCSSSSSTSSASSATSASEGSWRTRLAAQRPPLLRLGMSRKSTKGSGSRRGAIIQPTLESIPGSPSANIETSPVSDDILYSSFEKDDPFGAFADSSYIELDPKVPIPTFTIPSDASLRREKMRRLKRKLGDNIPVYLVFPPIAESDEEEVIIHSPTTPTSMTHSESSFTSSCDSSSALISTESEGEHEDVLPPLRYLPPLRKEKSRLRLRHEIIHQYPRKSSFVDAKKPLPPVPPLPPTTRTIKRRSGQFIIHYECADDHAVQAFDGLRCAVGAETGIGYAI